MIKVRLVAASFALAALVPLALSGQMYLSDDEQDAIYTVDLASGQATLVGPAGLDMSFSGLAYDSSNGVLYASDVLPPGGEGESGAARNADAAIVLGSFGLASVDLATGAATYIGPHVTSSNIHGLAYDSANDVLYGADINSAGLSVIDRASGLSTPVGPWGTTVEIRGLAYDAATDTLYGVDYDPATLYTINRATGAATPVGPLGPVAGFYEGLEIDPGTGLLYFVDDVTLQLHSLNGATGQATAIGPLNGPDLPSGLASIGGPAPPDWVVIPTLGGIGLGLLALGLAFVAFRLLRRSPAAA